MTSTTDLLRSAVFALALGAGSCDPGPATTSGAAAVDRDVFVAVYVDLRAAAVRGDERTLAPDVRDGLLARHGVTAAELLDFVEVHGTDIDFMQDVWNDVEAELDGTRMLIDSTAGPGAD